MFAATHWALNQRYRHDDLHRLTSELPMHVSVVDEQFSAELA